MAKIGDLQIEELFWGHAESTQGSKVQTRGLQGEGGSQVKLVDKLGGKIKVIVSTGGLTCVGACALGPGAKKLESRDGGFLNSYSSGL